MGWLVIVKSRSKTFSTSCVLFCACFAWKKIHSIAGTTVQVTELNAIFPVGTEKEISKCFSSHNRFAYFAPSTFPWPTTASLLFLSSQKSVFQTFISSKLNYRNLLKNHPCFLTGVNGKCISDSKFLSFRNTEWYVILKTKLLSFLINFQPWTFSCLKDLSSYKFVTVTLFIQQYFQFIASFIKKAFSEQILLRRKAWLEGIDFLQWER